MKKLYFCGHTGSNNRGCEAIVRSSVAVLGEEGLRSMPYLATFAPKEDSTAGIDNLCELIPYGQYSSKLQRGICAFRRKVLKDPFAGQDIIQHRLWEAVDKDDLCLNIGGDTYCYGTPTVFMAHNRKMQQLGVPVVLWCCSVEKDRLEGAILEDIKRYDMIVARETITRDALVSAGIPKDKVLLCCDPAFNLHTEPCALPEGFAVGNTLGLNVSGLVLSPLTMEAVEYFIERILSDTNMSICLVPHVYTASPESGDLKLLRELFAKYKDTNRISLVQEDLTCEQLKFVISQCRFFVGARTHSTIAAYSSSVPTLVLGYSVKSRGIARDIFGTEKGYVLPYTDIKSKEDIYSAFSDIMSKEDEIKALYERFMPDYKATVHKTAQIIIRKYFGE